MKTLQQLHDEEQQEAWQEVLWLRLRGELDRLAREQLAAERAARARRRKLWLTLAGVAAALIWGLL